MINIRITLLFSIFIFIHAHNAYGHGQLKGRIESLNHEIHHHQKDATLYLKRGRLHQEKRQFKQAIADFNAVIKYDKKNRSVYYYRAEVELATIELEKAIASAKKFISTLKANEPEALSRGYSLLGTIYHYDEQSSKASIAFNKVLKLKSKPLPLDYINAAESTYAANPKNYQQANLLFHKARKNLGNAAPILEKHIQLSIRAKDFDTAIEINDILIKDGQRLAFLYLRKGDIQELASLPKEAKQSYQLSWSWFQKIPRSRQKVSANQHLKATLEKKLGKLEPLKPSKKNSS